MISKHQFSKAVTVITGSARGIGKNIARAFCRTGAQVLICDIDEDKGRATESEFRAEGWNSEFVQVDLSQKGAPQLMIRQIVQQYGKIDILINNARAGRRVALLEEDEENWEDAMAVILKAPFFLSQEAIRAMGQGAGGNIINIGSVAAFMVCHESAHYHIAKAGLMQMTRYLAVYSGSYGVRINAVLPGFIIKDEHLARYNHKDNEPYRNIAEFCHPLGKTGLSDMIADTVLFLCSSEASFINGQCINVDGGLTLHEQSSLLYRYNKEKHCKKRSI